MTNIVCYLLMDGGAFEKGLKVKTYRGYTVNLKQRLRRHRGEIQGGAKYTKCFDRCDVLCHVSGFSTKNMAMSFEWFTKKRRCPSTDITFLNLHASVNDHHRKLLARFVAVCRHEKFQGQDLILHLSPYFWPPTKK